MTTADPRQPSAGTAAEGPTDRVAALRPAYQADLADGTGRFFHPRRTDCPWCASTALRTRLHTTDLLQHKPGRFVLDTCGDCGHTFQNPQLNDKGLEFYYRDFYDGLGEQRLAKTFAGRAALHRRQAGSVLPHSPTPRDWLDVGTGHGHFCATARDVFPGTGFDGVDLSQGVELAEREGRLRRGLRGLLPELAPRLAGQYDVVSMLHYLEHTTDPARELAAAHQVLRPGGLLLVEVPDPGSRFARLLGRWWLPWLQPQHLHLTPVANLRRRLEAIGFTVVAEQHGEAHDPIDLLAAAWLLLDHLAPREDAPWHPDGPPGLLRRILRPALLLAGAPLLIAAMLLDRLLAPIAGRTGHSNAYRLLARRTT
ncbi:class I SAM-dependent methyltransferase [Kitasatospora sp. A2-31]|uniref:class I SAM-dependent methyltransferase n=1 Tax=Kitasatospora sp. A2-31 TaxID=2916414 RepID=UPI001EECEBC7|nr:class I SAM-dependent methyltransferase [Kitasatospora sp. A2-31]MCG6493957.1 class I SAM-dependent methyltransferase [Kitasatospora sp. A2-31]